MEKTNINQHKEYLDNLGRLCNMLPADVLKKVNELLEQLHRADKEHQGGSKTCSADSG